MNAIWIALLVVDAFIIELKYATGLCEPPRDHKFLNLLLSSMKFNSNYHTIPEGGVVNKLILISLTIYRSTKGTDYFLFAFTIYFTGTRQILLLVK